MWECTRVLDVFISLETSWSAMVNVFSKYSGGSGVWGMPQFQAPTQFSVLASDRYVARQGPGNKVSVG